MDKFLQFGQEINSNREVDLHKQKQQLEVAYKELEQLRLILAKIMEDVGSHGIMNVAALAKSERAIKRCNETNEKFADVEKRFVE